MRSSFLLFSLVAAFSFARSETVADLKNWTIDGVVEMDASKPGPSGAPSIKVGPGAKALLKLRDGDGSGKVTILMYDDGKIASPDKKKSLGPRWGTVESNGRVAVGAVMYARFLQPEGSYCFLDADPKDKASWLNVHFLSPRGTPGWKKWEFEFDPGTGLKVSVDGKPLPQKYFDWNTSQVTGFNGLALFGDATPGETAQTIWVGDIAYELGPPMKVKPGSVPPPPPLALPAAKGPAPEEATANSSEPPIMGKMDGFTPGATLMDDLKNLKIPLTEGYAAQHPRLLFSAGDKADLVKRSLERPDLWNAVMDSAKGLKDPASVPTPDLIRSGAKYWRVEKVESGALAWFVTGDKEIRDGAIRWLVAHCKEAVWGTTYRPNLDLVASWYLYHCAIGYDILKDDMTEEDRKLVRESLAQHARWIYLDHDPNDTKEQINYDQNHTYIPCVALMSAALALLDEVPESKYWLTRSYAVLRRSRYVQSEDGYYYEGYGYWTYAMNWQVRGAELLARATGEKLFNLPLMRDNWLFGLHLNLPGTPGAFCVGDCGGFSSDGKRIDLKFNNYTMLWKIATETNSPETRAVGDKYYKLQPDLDLPSSAFLWFNPKVEPANLDKTVPYHYFPDHDVVAWRSGWDADATCYLFRCGPPLGHKALAKTELLKDWRMNAGHVHPDIGTFWMFAKGTYLAVDTGYTAEKWTKDSNTLLIDDKGQGQDGTYWNERGIPYADLDGAKITAQYLSPEYGFAKGDFGSVYKNKLKATVKLSRAVLMTKRYLLVVDDMCAEQPHKLTWLCHSDGEFKPEGAAFVARQAKAGLAVLPLAPEKVDAKAEPTMVMAGKAPGKGTSVQHGFVLGLSTPAPVDKVRFINLLVPVGTEEKAPTVESVKNENGVVSLQINWANGKTESVQVDLGWKSGEKGPAVVGK
ncbi:hypothetical protein BH09VER1_BH09VER1_13040 [soil metagenome]